MGMSDAEVRTRLSLLWFLSDFPAIESGLQNVFGSLNYWLCSIRFRGAVRSVRKAYELPSPSSGILNCHRGQTATVLYLP